MTPPTRTESLLAIGTVIALAIGFWYGLLVFKHWCMANPGTAAIIAIIGIFWVMFKVTEVED